MIELITAAALSAISEVLGIPMAHEHQAIHYRGDNATEYLSFWRRLGYEVVSSNDGDKTVFIQKDDHRLELINEDLPQHDAWAVKHLHQFKSIINSLDESPKFMRIPKYSVYNNPEMRAEIFVCTSSDDIFQIVWRDEPIYEGVSTQE